MHRHCGCGCFPLCLSANQPHLAHLKLDTFHEKSTLCWILAECINSQVSEGCVSPQTSSQYSASRHPARPPLSPPPSCPRPGMVGGGGVEGWGLLDFALSRLRHASAVTHIDANMTERTQKADIRLCLQPRSSGGRRGSVGGGRRALKASPFPFLPLEKKNKLKKNLPAL